ncbi:uncharacterized protein LOC131008553 isoform X2 [Salvia miltiorrhiza]|uniref:uncharacterized protein LOC131008553 isoform X2 n=1 Tax=Salvia miltiorrhiza TaxID=226208 RepID=UPI0025AB8C5E|nr:uncharacterized protein LOC131008553 isoform X2 [Salvia miltiorrhiza]
MAFRSAAYWKSMVKVVGSCSSFTTSTLPKLKAYAPAATHVRPSSASGDSKSKLGARGDMFPVLMAVGMISLSAGFGLFTAWHQLGRGPNLYVKKSRRETIPEVVEPEHVAEEAEKFVKQSFFRKVAHIQELDRQNVMSDPLRGDVFTRAVKVETLRDAGVDPEPN